MTRLLIWAIWETSGFDSTWATVDDDRLEAIGRSCGLLPAPYWLSYHLQTDRAYRTRDMRVESRWDQGTTQLELHRDDQGWTVNGTPRADLADALDCDLAACPLTNIMPIRRHKLHQEPGDHTFVMAFIEIPTLNVVPSRQRYTHLRRTDEGAVVQYRSGSFESELVVDNDGFVIDYPKLGRRLQSRSPMPGIRPAGPG